MLTKAAGVKVNLEVPKGVPAQARESAERRAREAAVLDLWEAAAISTRQAAEELGLSYGDFLDLLSREGIAIVRDSDPEALEAVRRKLAEERDDRA